MIDEASGRSGRATPSPDAEGQLPDPCDSSGPNAKGDAIQIQSFKMPIDGRGHTTVSRQAALRRIQPATATRSDRISKPRRSAPSRPAPSLTFRIVVRERIHFALSKTGQFLADKPVRQSALRPQPATDPPVAAESVRSAPGRFAAPTRSSSTIRCPSLRSGDRGIRHGAPGCAPHRA